MKKFKRWCNILFSLQKQLYSPKCKTLEIYFDTEDIKNLGFESNIYNAVEPTIVLDIANHILRDIKN